MADLWHLIAKYHRAMAQKLPEQQQTCIAPETSESQLCQDMGECLYSKQYRRMTKMNNYKDTVASKHPQLRC